MAVDDVLHEWAAHDGCTGDPVVSGLSAGSLLTWHECSTPVGLYRLTSGGHQWTPQTPDRLWPFFEALPVAD